MKVSNTWKPVLSEEITNTCIPTKSIQIYVEHLQKYSPSRKAVQLFKYNASSTRAANEASLVPSVSSSSLNSLYSRCPSNDVTKVKDLPTAFSKLIHIDLKQLTHTRSFDGAEIASAEKITKSNLPQIVSEQNSKQYTCDPEQTSNQQKKFYSTSKNTAPIIVNNVVYTSTSEKRYSTVPPHAKMFSPKMVLQKLSKKTPSNLQQSKAVSTKTVQLPHSLATLRITNRTKKPLMSDPKTETEDIINKERKNPRKTQIKTRLDLLKPKLNCILNNQELPVLNLPTNHPVFLQKNQKQINDVHKNRNLLVFNEQISKFQALHELIKLLREQKRSYPENNFLQQIHKKLKKDKCYFNMARQQKVKEELNTSSANQSNHKENVKNQKQSFCRLRTFCSKVQPYSVVDRPAKTDLCTLATKVALSTNFKRNNSEPTGSNELHSQQDKTTSTANQNKLRCYALRGHIKLSSSNGHLFNHIHLKPGNTGKKGFIIDDLKINLIGLEKKIRKYTQKRITPLCEESKFERNKLNTISREMTKVQEKCVLGRASNPNEYKMSASHKDMGSTKKAEFRINRTRKDTSISLPESLIFKKQIPVCTKFSDTKNLENSILVKSCFHDRQVKSVQSNNKDSLQQQNPSTKETTIIQSIKKSDSKLDCNRKQATRLKNNPWKMNTTQLKDTTSKLKQTPDNASRIAAEEVSSKNQKENWRVKSPRQMYNKDTLKAFTFQSQSFYSDYEHRKFHRF